MNIPSPIPYPPIIRATSSVTIPDYTLLEYEKESILTTKRVKLNVLYHQTASYEVIWNISNLFGSSQNSVLYKDFKEALEHFRKLTRGLF